MSHTPCGGWDKAYQADGVKIVQKALNNLSTSGSKLTVDGKMGSKTIAKLDSMYQTKQVNQDLFDKLRKSA